jgi:hypothetical protein
MANSDKNIVITPNINQAAQPSVVFKGQGNVPITLKVLDDSYGTLSFEGSAGQLFSINNNLTSGVIFAVNDVSGIPQIDVNANGTIRIGPFGGQVGIGISTPIATGLTINRLSTDAGTGQLMISNPNNTNVRFNLGYHTSSNYAFINSYTSSLSSQPLILQEWFDGRVGLGSLTSPDAKLDIRIGTATTKGLIVRGFTSQSANLTEWQNSAGTVLSSINASGNFSGTASGSVSGTTSYVPKFTSANVIGNSQIFDNGTNVGIGTASPASELHVYSTVSPQLRIEGSSDAYLALYRSNVYGGYIGLGSAGNNDIYVYNANSGAFRVGLTNGNLQALYVSPSSNVGINETSPGAQLQVTTAAAATKGLIVKGASAQSANLLELQNSAGTLLAAVNSSGEFGIGTSPVAGRSIYANNAIVTTGSVVASFGSFDITISGTSIGRGSGAGNISFGNPGASQAGTTIGYNTAGTTVSAGVLSVVCNNAASKGLIVKGFTSQSVNLQEWQNVAGSALATVDSAGNFSAANYSGTTATSNNLLQYYVKEYTFFRNTPTTVGNYIEVCDYNEVTGFMEVTVASESAGGIGHSIKRYYLAAAFAQLRNVIICPTFMERQSGYTSSFDFELESASISAYTNRLRIRRTAGTAARYVTVTVKVYSPYAHSLTEQTGTGTSSIGNSFWNRLTGTYLSVPPVVGGSGAGNHLYLYSGSGETAGAGGSVYAIAGDAAGTNSGGSVYLNNKQSAATTSSSAVVMGYLSSHSLAFHTFNRTLPDTVGDYVEVCAFNAQIGGWIEMEVVINKHAASYGCKTYCFGNLYYSGVAILQPVAVQSAAYAGFFNNSFEVELDCSSTSVSVVRIRRTAADSTSVPLYISIKSRTSGLTERSGTGTSSAGSSLHQTERRFPTVITPMSVPGNSGNGLSMTVAAGSGAGTGTGGNLTLQAGNASTSGAGGSIILQPGAQATTGGNGVVVVRQPGGTAGTDELQIYHDGTHTYFANKDTSGNIYFDVPAGTNPGLFIRRSDYTSQSLKLTSGDIDNLATVQSVSTDVQLRSGSGDVWIRPGTSSNYVTNWYAIRIRNLNGQNGAILSIPGNSPAGVLQVIDSSGSGGGSIAYAANSPSAFSADQNDLVLSSSAFQRLSGTAARNITGVAPPTSGSHVDGRMMRIYNVGSTYNLTLKHNSTSSTATNRFYCVQAADIVIAPNDYAELIYDSTDNGRGGAGWRVA